LIHVEHLTRRFGALTAIDDLTFHLEKGEVVGFLGPNGAGKTTAMRILAGYLSASSGRAEISGLDVLRRSLEVRRRIGYLPESVPLYREHRVEEMLVFQARLHGLARRDWKQRIPEVLERVGLSDRRTHLIGNLSRGLRQRVGLAVALLPRPEVLILDEPTSGLDPLQRIEVRGLLKGLSKEHTVLLSSHILPEIEAVCPRVIILNKGRIAADGTADQLVRQLGGASYVRLEAHVGHDLAGALRLLRALPGVAAVEDRGRLGIHQVFDIACEEDLREDVGAISAQKGWALRELSWKRPALEQIFARIAMGFDSMGPAQAPEAPAQPTAAEPLLHVDAALAGAATATPALGVSGHTARVGKPVYNLNPFDGGARRDLSRPKIVEAPDATTAQGPAGDADPDCEARP
jgi:ABC-2 type transport system ATP-binding protein